MFRNNEEIPGGIKTKKIGKVMKGLPNIWHNFRTERFQIPIKPFLFENGDPFGNIVITLFMGPVPVNDRQTPPSKLARFGFWSKKLRNFLKATKNKIFRFFFFEIWLFKILRIVTKITKKKLSQRNS